MKRLLILTLFLPLSAVPSSRRPGMSAIPGPRRPAASRGPFWRPASTPTSRPPRIGLGEEAEFIPPGPAGDHDILRALTAPRARVAGWTGDARPSAFAVLGEARYGSAADLAQRMPGPPPGARPGGLLAVRRRTHFELVCYPEQAPDGDIEAAKVLYPLLEGLDAYRLVLTRGRFTSAEGFRIEDDGRVASLIEPDEQAVKAAGGAVVLRLTWQDEP